MIYTQNSSILHFLLQNVCDSITSTGGKKTPALPEWSLISKGQIMYQRTSCNYLYSKNSVYTFKERKWAVWQYSFSSAHFTRVHAIAPALNDGWLMMLRPVAFLTLLSALKTNYTFHPDNMSITRFGNSCRSIKYFVCLNNS